MGRIDLKALRVNSEKRIEMNVLEEKTLTIILVSYNEKEYIRQALDSCLGALLFLDEKYEIIIGDDGSDDGSIEGASRVP